MLSKAISPGFRPVSSIDLAAACAAVVLPKSWQPRIDQTRLDLRSVLDAVRGHHEQSFRSPKGGPRPSTPLDTIDPVEHVLPQSIASRYVVTRRDMHFLRQSILGRHPPPFTRRRQLERSMPEASAVNAGRTTRWFRVTDVEPATGSAVTIHLEAPPDTFGPFQLGQFVTIVLELEGRTYRRAYSICSAPQELPRLAITVKRVNGGIVSNHLNDKVRGGDFLRVHGPAGTFVVKPEAQLRRHFVLLAAGAGITPMLSIVGGLTRYEPETRIDLIYGNRNEASILFRDQLEALASGFPERFSVRHVLSQPSDEWDGCVGRVDEKGAPALLDEVVTDQTLYLVCGPEAMMAAVRSVLRQRGIPDERIAQERFVAPRATRLFPHSLKAQPAIFRRDGADHNVIVASGKTLLQAGLDAGVPLRYSCAMGGCGACRVKVRRGSAQMDEPNALTSQEREQGYVLACVAYPTEPIEVESE